MSEQHPNSLQRATSETVGPVTLFPTIDLLEPTRRTGAPQEDVQA
jgi:hypothetical protein